MSGKLIFYVKQHKSLSTDSQKRHFLNSKVLYQQVSNNILQIDGRKYGRTDGHTDTS